MWAWRRWAMLGWSGLAVAAITAGVACGGSDGSPAGATSPAATTSPASPASADRSVAADSADDSGGASSVSAPSPAPSPAADAGSGEQAVARTEATAAVAPPGPGSVVLDRLYYFNDAGSLPLDDATRISVARGSVTVEWYLFRGWYAAVFRGLDAAAINPVCIGTSVLNRALVEVQQISNAPLAPGGCDDAGAGRVFPAQPPSGVRQCGDVVAYVTPIPGDAEGTLYASITEFLGDGTGIGLSGGLDVRFGALPEIDPALVDCGPLPHERTLVAPLPPEEQVIAVPAPPSEGVIAFEDRPPPPALTPPAACAPAAAGVLQEVTDTPGAPYFVHHPLGGGSGPTVVFLGGGSGGRSAAESIWGRVFADAPQTANFRVVLPYVTGGDLINEARRVFVTVNEVLGCYGGDPAQVHIAGTSNGGLAAYALMAERPQVFATLAGLPGAFPVQDPTTLDPALVLQVMGGRAVFNAAGSSDNDWKSEVIATHNVLVAAGVESVYYEIPNQGHILTSLFDPTPLFDFWIAHSGPRFN